MRNHLRAAALICSIALAFQLWAQPLPPQGPIPDYDRSEWGRWGTTDERGGGGCRWGVRHLLLRNLGQATDGSSLVTREEGGSCRVVALTIVDRYTGRRLTGPSKGIHIDHLVPLAEAHRSGAWTWSDEERRRFHPINLVPTLAKINLQKSDRDPASWWPPDESQHCWYAKQWVAVKQKYDLIHDGAEAAALIDQLVECLASKDE